MTAAVLSLGWPILNRDSSDILSERYSFNAYDCRPRKLANNRRDYPEAVSF